MTQQPTTRVPVDDAYATLIGKTVYVFAYYEWTIIWIIERLCPGFVRQYSRGNPMSSGCVLERLRRAKDSPATSFGGATRQELEECVARFEALVTKRNALIHAHPATDVDGAQVLVYQSKATRPLPDMKWSHKDVVAVLAEFDQAASTSGGLLHKLG